MVTIIESEDTPGTGTAHLQFNVYRSPKDGKTILGYVSSGAFIHSGGKRAIWLSTPYGVQVGEAYAKALEIAEQHGLAVWLRDEGGLFPPSARHC